LAIVFLLQGVQLPKASIPVGFQRVSDHPIGGIDAHVTPAGEFGVVTRALQLLGAHFVGLFDAPSDLVLDSECHFDGRWRNSLEQQ
jgi:hypothetical protein